MPSGKVAPPWSAESPGDSINYPALVPALKVPAGPCGDEADAPTHRAGPAPVQQELYNGWDKLPPYGLGQALEAAAPQSMTGPAEFQDIPGLAEQRVDILLADMLAAPAGHARRELRRRDSYKAMGVLDLKRELTRRGLDSVFCFSKEDLVQRLIESDARN